ncbi:hypothetical protein NMG60_11000068 [Bertholletia excelsa]
MAVLVKLAFVVLTSMVVAAPHAEAITCGQVQSSLLPCLSFLRNGVMGEGCCKGVTGLNNMARTPADRQQACKCMKNGYNQIPGIKTQYASQLPSKCGVSIPYKISPTTDCSKVN